MISTLPRFVSRAYLQPERPLDRLAMTARGIETPVFERCIRKVISHDRADLAEGQESETTLGSFLETSPRNSAIPHPGTVGLVASVFPLEVCPSVKAQCAVDSIDRINHFYLAQSRTMNQSSHRRVASLVVFDFRKALAVGFLVFSQPLSPLITLASAAADKDGKNAGA